MTRHVLELIDAIYECVDHPELWQDALGRLSDLMRSGGTQLLVADLGTGRELIGASARMPPEAHIEYMRDYYATDLRAQRLITLPIGTIVDERMVLNEDEIRSDPVINEFEPRYELANLTGSNLMLGSTFVWLGTARASTPRAFDEDELAVLAAILPHVRRAVRLSLELSSKDPLIGLLANLHARSGKAILVLSATPRLSFANEYAQTLADVGLISVLAGQLSFTDRRAQREFQRILSSWRITRYPGEPSEFLAYSLDEQCFGVRVHRHLGPIRDLAIPESDKLVVTIVPLADAVKVSSEDVHRFGGLFGMTPAEERVILAVAHDTDLSEYAVTTAVALDTVRKHLKSVLMKTGARSQKQLLRRLERFCFLATH